MTSSAVGANLQMHYNYRWILLTLETEPVCHFLSRHLQRRLIEHEISSNTKSCLLGKVVEWLSTVWVQLNKFLKNRFASPESTLGELKEILSYFDVSIAIKMMLLLSRCKLELFEWSHLMRS